MNKLYFFLELLRLKLYQMCGRLALLEKKVAGALCGLILLLILTNVLTRFLKLPIFWIDEVAVYAMIWMAFLSASSAVYFKQHIAVSLLTDNLPAKFCGYFSKLAEGIMLLLASALVVLSWIWFEPLALIESGGDLDDFSNITFNFIYSEPTVSSGIPKFVFWLIVPVFSINLTLHCLAHFIGRPRVIDSSVQIRPKIKSQSRVGET
ncbi:MAG: TRAP transporter small permease [Kangiellaceae bacterium]|nr:TRAP transporter small permease [Kangiellaceae bacterium]